MSKVNFHRRKIRRGDDLRCAVCLWEATNGKTGKPFAYDYAEVFPTGGDTTRFHLGIFCSDDCFSARQKGLLDPEGAVMSAN